MKQATKPFVQSLQQDDRSSILYSTIGKAVENGRLGQGETDAVADGYWVIDNWFGKEWDGQRHRWYGISNGAMPMAGLHCNIARLPCQQALKSIW